MKKKMIALLAGALMMISASSAFAAFGDYELIRVVYNASTGDEVATDLGNVNSLITSANATGSVTVGNGADAYTGYGANFAASKDSQLYVAYLAADILGGSNNLWLSATKGTTATGSAYSGLNSSLIGTFSSFGLYGSQSATTLATKGQYSGYMASFDPDGGQGTFANFLSTLGQGEANLANLATASVQQGLYYWADGSQLGTGTPVGTNLTILTNADGSTTLATPIPAAIYLMGSGLLGMLGLRRKQRG